MKRDDTQISEAQSTPGEIEAKFALEVQKLRLEIAALERAQCESKFALEVEKLRLEIVGLGRSQRWDRLVGRFLPLATTVLALAGFWLGIFQFTRNERVRLNQAATETQRLQESREKEFKRSFWEKQLAAYAESVNLAAELANRQTAKDAEPLYRRFVDLYHGQMVLYEDPDVLVTMKAFVQVYIEYRQDPGLQNNAKAAARAFAHACRKSLANTWNIPLNNLDMSTF